MKTPLLILCVVVFNVNRSPAQDTKIDSLLSLLNVAARDTNQVIVLNELAYRYRNIEPDTGLLYSQKALELAEQLQWKPGIGKSYKCMGNNYFSISEPQKALDVYGKALKNYGQTADKADIAEVLMNIGNVHQFLLSDYLKALEYYNRSLPMFEQMNNKRGIAMNFSSLAIIYEIMGDYPKALETFQKTLNLYEQLGNRDGMSKQLANMAIFYSDMHEYPKALEYCNKSLRLFAELGNRFGTAATYLTMGSIYLDLLDFPHALSYYQKSLDIYEQLGERSGIAKNLGNMGMVYANASLFDKALEYYQRSFKLNKQLGNKSGMANVLLNIGDVYLQAPDSSLQRTGVRAGSRYKQALDNLNSSLEISREIGELELQETALEKLSAVYEKQGNFARAHSTYKEYITTRDSILNDAKRREIAQKEIAYIYDKKEVLLKAEHEKKTELANAEIKRQRSIRNYTLGGASVAAMLSCLLIWSYNHRLKIGFDKQVSEVEMKALRSQMNPHFIFNSLQSINKYVLNNDKQNASEYLSKFARLMRLILENSREREVPLEQDLAAVELYMQLEALRFNNRFQYKIELDENIDPENTLVPPLMIQPFVENSILHGIHQKENGLIRIKVNREGSMIRCIVEDNGAGREQAVEIQSEEHKRESLGMKITQERLQIINQLKKAKSAIKIFDIRDGQNRKGGLRIELLIPYQQAF